MTTEAPTRDNGLRHSALTLDGQPPGAMLRVVAIEGGRGRIMRLLGLGVRVGSELVVANTRGRGVVVASEAGRVAIGFEMARHIYVEGIAR